MLIRQHFLFVLFLIFCSFASAQKIIVNGYDSIYELSGTPGDCTLGPSIPYCTNNYDRRLLSTALHNNILYFITGTAYDLYRAVLGKPGQCERVAFLPEDQSSRQYNALTVDLYGNVYALSVGSQLVRYRDGDVEPTILGKVPEPSGGDMLYYKGELYYATLNGEIYKINLANPAASTKHMSVPGFIFIGLISFPYDCNKNKIYGITDAYPQSQLVELDLENKTYSGVICTLPAMVFDAASVVEDGKTLGVLLDSITLNPSCGSQASGSLQLHAFSAAPGTLTYTVDGVSTSTGYFDGIMPGLHTIQVSTAGGCKLDTSIFVARALNPQFTVSRKEPTSCTQRDGELIVSGVTTGYFPVTYSLDGGAFSNMTRFTGLAAGKHTLSLRDKSGCRIDTMITLSYQGAARSISSLVTMPSTCNGPSGEIHLTLDPALTNWTVSLNNATAAKKLHYSNLVPNTYNISVFGDGGCRYDTTVILPSINQLAPSMNVTTTEATCGKPNGRIRLDINGPNPQYTINWQRQNFPDDHHFNGLLAGQHLFTIFSSGGCSWDTIVILPGHTVDPAQWNVTAKNPSCVSPDIGELAVTVSGTQAPYKINIAGKIINPGSTIAGLQAGAYPFTIINADGCVAASGQHQLLLTDDPACDRFIMPNAFSPNGDGHNETIKPVHSPFVREMQCDIFNRYGQRVHRYLGTGSGWNGMSGSQPAPAGNYIWSVRYINNKGKRIEHKGSFLLIR